MATRHAGCSSWLAMSTKKTEVIHYALIAAAALPVARIGGEPTVLVFCVIAVVLTGLSRKRY